MVYYSSRNFILRFERRVQSTIRQFSLASKSDKIVVLVSGGKDSTAVLYILHNLGYNTIAMHMNLGIGKWSDMNEQNVRRFCSSEGIPLKVLDFERIAGKPMRVLRDELRLRHGRRLCYTCGITRRRIFNKVARELGATRVATGHNLDDEAQSAIMSILTANRIALSRFGPIADSSGSSMLVPRIKPLFFCPEGEVRRYSELKGFPVLYQPCPCSYDAFRGEIEKFLNTESKHSASLKLRVVQNALALKRIIEVKRVENVKECSLCGEPSSGEVCKACEIFAISSAA